MKKLVTLALIAAISLSGIAVPADIDHPLSAFAASTAASGNMAPPPSYYSGLSFVSGGAITLRVGKAQKLDLSRAGGTIVWTSSNRNVATVDQGGTVLARKAGVTRISARNLETNRSASCTVKVYRTRTQAQVRKALLALKKTYRPGKRWTNENYYYWQAANCHCYGCIAFVGIASDRAFGKFAPLKRHARYSRIKVGDHLRIGSNHSVVVLRKDKKSVVVAEGNYNDAINWGRVIPYAELRREGFYVETRY